MARILSIADDIAAHPSSKKILKRREPLSMPVRRMNSSSHRVGASTSVARVSAGGHFVDRVF
jgi:hypothetical protein